MEIIIYDVITSELASGIAHKLRTAPKAPVHIEINSPGGDVHAALSITNNLIAHQGLVTIRVSGVAASAATLICCAGTVEASSNTLFMIHAPWLSTTENADGLRRQANILDKHADAMMGIYARKTGRSLEDISRFFDGKDHWMSADEAQAVGLVNKIIAPLKIAAEFKFGGLHCPVRFLMNENVTATMPIAAPPAAFMAAAPPAAFMAAADIARACQDAGESALTAQLLSKPHTADEIKARLDMASTVRKICAMANVPEITQTLVDMNCTESQAKQIIWASLVARDEATPIDATPRHIETQEFGGYGRNQFFAAAESALLTRMGIHHKPHPAAQDFRHTSIRDMAEIALRQSGRPVRGGTPSDLIQAALTTSDFPALLSGTANRALVERFEAAAIDHRALATTSNLRDFKLGKAINVSFVPGLAKKLEAEPITYSSITDGAEPIQLATFARGLAFSREAMINDDLGGINRSIQVAANAAIRAERDLLFGVITTNAVMSDSVALFHATHANLGTGALSPATLGEARTYLRKQVDQSGGYVATNPRYLVVPVALETNAESIIAALSYRTDLAGPETMSPGWQNKLQVIADPRLDASSKTTWYLFSDPNTAPVIELAFLNGMKVPVVEQDTDFDRDILRFKIRFDVGVAAVGFAGAVKMA